MLDNLEIEEVKSLVRCLWMMHLKRRHTSREWWLQQETLNAYKDAVAALLEADDDISVEDAKHLSKQ